MLSQVLLAKLTQDFSDNFVCVNWVLFSENTVLFRMSTAASKLCTGFILFLSSSALSPSWSGTTTTSGLLASCLRLHCSLD